MRTKAFPGFKRPSRKDVHFVGHASYVSAADCRRVLTAGQDSPLSLNAENLTRSVIMDFSRIPDYIRLQMLAHSDVCAEDGVPPCNMQIRWALVPSVVEDEAHDQEGGSHVPGDDKYESSTIASLLGVINHINTQDGGVIDGVSTFTFPNPAQLISVFLGKDEGLFAGQKTMPPGIVICGYIMPKSGGCVCGSADSSVRDVSVVVADCSHACGETGWHCGFGICALSDISFDDCAAHLLLVHLLDSVSPQDMHFKSSGYSFSPSLPPHGIGAGLFPLGGVTP